LLKFFPGGDDKLGEGGEPGSRTIREVFRPVSGRPARNDVMDDALRAQGPKSEILWTDNEGRDEFRDWLQQIHRDAVEHTEQIHQRQSFPQWLKG
jgi:hypothetical protein